MQNFFNKIGTLFSKELFYVTINHESGKLVAMPDIVSLRFVYVRESEELMEEAKNRVIHLYYVGRMKIFITGRQ